MFVWRNFTPDDQPDTAHCVAQKDQHRRMISKGEKTNMKCPKCRSEVGNQPVCPYCGGTIYISPAATWTNDGQARRSFSTNEGRPEGRRIHESREIERRLRVLETKVDLILVIQVGSFALLVLTLIVLAIK